MKILYVTNHNQILQQSGGYLNDYLNDLLFYGFTELNEVEDEGEYNQEIEA